MRSLERIVALLLYYDVRLSVRLSVCLGRACIVIIQCTSEIGIKLFQPLKEF